MSEVIENLTPGDFLETVLTEVMETVDESLPNSNEESQDLTDSGSEQRIEFETVDLSAVLQTQQESDDGEVSCAI